MNVSMDIDESSTQPGETSTGNVDEEEEFDESDRVTPAPTRSGTGKKEVTVALAESESESNAYDDDIDMNDHEESGTGTGLGLTHDGTIDMDPHESDDHPALHTKEITIPHPALKSQQSTMTVSFDLHAAKQKLHKLFSQSLAPAAGPVLVSPSATSTPSAKGTTPAPPANKRLTQPQPITSSASTPRQSLTNDIGTHSKAPKRKVSAAT